MFLGATPVEVEITQMTCLESNPHAHWNPYLYTIEVTHGEYKWTVKKRYNQFLKLHTAIMLSGRDTDDVRTKNQFNLSDNFLFQLFRYFCFCFYLKKVGKLEYFCGKILYLTIFLIF